MCVCAHMRACVYIHTPIGRDRATFVYRSNWSDKKIKRVRSMRK